MYGAAITLRQHVLDEQQRQTLLEIVATEAARLGRLLDDVLWVNRLDSDRADTFIASVDPVAVVSEVVNGARTHLPPALAIDVRHPEATPPVAADPDKLRQVLVNLVENAVKYSGEGQIEVRLEPQDGAMRFSDLPSQIERATSEVRVLIVYRNVPAPRASTVAIQA